MAIKIGEVEALFRYPVKSMSGEAVETAELGWHGLDGDRRLGLRRIGDLVRRTRAEAGTGNSIEHTR